MSVLIKGMKMPKACLACPCFDEKDYVCKAIIKMLKKESIYHCRPEWCPLVAVPPHGRLIDADALELDSQKRLLICDKNDNQFQRPYEVIRAIALAPTVIPATEAREAE